jgi:hypothetical protein
MYSLSYLPLVRFEKKKIGKHQLVPLGLSVCRLLTDSNLSDQYFLKLGKVDLR